MPFSTLPNFGLNRKELPLRLGVLRLVAVLSTLATIAQWIIPVVARGIFNGGRIYYSNEPSKLYDSLLPWPVLSVPAWLTITTGLLAIGCACAYLLLGGLEISSDVSFMFFAPSLAGVFAIFIAAFEMDPTGVIWTPGPDGYPIGWHWVVAPFVLLLLAATLVSAARMKRLRAERRRRRAQHVTPG
ncbi:hypothetical protein ACLD0U_00565 [Microbacterium sp. 2216-1]|uniref:hypothetical protein n=1 Tax=Microbacterium TaxID=33882 RepID=UPI0015CE6F4D|nr:hypothetical protein [Microbacterium esteraromaticum]MBN7793658.1 hypothetical protein [Microbacterium esteraromaticum]MCA1307079.1 hypothetical protein [Microbacterium esteraromaticum]